MAALCGGLRWACSQLLLSSRRSAAQAVAAAEDAYADPHKSDGSGAVHPFALVYGTAAFGEVLLLPVASAVETRDLQVYLEESSSDELPSVVAVAMLGGVAAFFLLAAELRIVALSSGLTLSLAGIFKDVLTAAASVAILGEEATPYKVAGLAMCTVGIGLYNAIKLKEQREAELAARRKIAAAGVD